MKNHIRTPDGRLLQTNKSWSSLKQSQKEKIIGWFKLELSNYYEQNGEYPMDHKSEEVLHAVYDRIEEAGIWIPYGEVYREFNSRKMKMIHHLEKKKHPQEVCYLDMTDSENACTSIFAKDIKLIPAGTTVYAMSVSDKNPEYNQLAENYDIHFIFEDGVPDVLFYAVPRIDVFATAGGGYLATYGETTSLESNAKILFISKDGEIRVAAAHLRKLISTKKSWKGNMQKTKMVKLYSSKDEAMQQLKFFHLEAEEKSDGQD